MYNQTIRRNMNNSFQPLNTMPEVFTTYPLTIACVFALISFVIYVERKAEDNYWNKHDSSK